MAVYFVADRPQALLEEFDRRLDHPEEWRRIDAWKKTESGTYTVGAENWSGKAFMKPRVDADRLTFNIVKPEGQTMSSAVYSHYHGALVEAFLRQLDLMFSMITSTPRCTDGDQWA